MPFGCGPTGGRGFWRRGWRHWYYATGLPGWLRARLGYPAFGGWGARFWYGPTAKEEITLLKEQAEVLKDQLQYVENRIKELEKEEEQK